MNLKGMVKGSFKPTKLKIFVVLLLVFLFIFTISKIYSYSNSQMSDLCEGYQAYVIPALNVFREGDNETSEKLIEEFQKKSRFMNEVPLLQTLEIIYPVFGKVPLFFSFPCLPIDPPSLLGESPPCKKSYTSEENYECLLSSMNEVRLLQSEIWKTDYVPIEKWEYVQFSPFSHILSIILLIIESYIILSFLSLIISFSKEKYYNYKLDKRFNSKKRKKGR